MQSDRERELLKLIGEKLSEDEADDAEEIAKEILDSELKRQAHVQIVSYHVLEGNFDESDQITTGDRFYFTDTEILELAVKVKDDGRVDMEEFANFIVALPEPPAK